MVNVDEKLDAARFIVENNCSYQKAADFFDVSAKTIYKRVKTIEKIDNKLYTQAKEIIDSHNPKNRELKCKEIGEYVLKNNCTLSECAKAFGFNISTISKHIQKLKQVDEEMYLKVKKTSRTAADATRNELRKNLEIKRSNEINNPEFQDKIADWVIENDSTLKEAAIKFGYKRDSLTRAMKKLKERNKDKYEQVYKVCASKRAINKHECKKYIRSFVELETEEQDAVKLLSRIRKFKENLETGGKAKCKVTLKVEAERSDGTTYLKDVVTTRVVNIMEKHKNYILTDYGVVYYQDCISKIVNKKVDV